MGRQPWVAAFGRGIPAALWLGLLPTPAASHGPLHEQIAALTVRIDREPADATLYLRRGELRGLHEEWDEALADYDRAASLAPGLAAVDLARGKTLLLARRNTEAREALDRYLSRLPDDPDALTTRARALAALGGSRAAAADYALAIALLEPVDFPKPDLYLEWARAVAAAGDPEGALGALDAGIGKLGPLASLELPAVELELSAGRDERALARLGALASRSPRPEPWLVRRGEILERAGRLEEARRAYGEALEGLERLPRRKRMPGLESSVRSALGRLEEKP